MCFQRMILASNYLEESIISCHCMNSSSNEDGLGPQGERIQGERIHQCDRSFRGEFLVNFGLREPQF